MKIRHLWVWCAALACLGVGCAPSSVPTVTTPMDAPMSAVQTDGSWSPVADGIDTFDYRFATSTSANLVLYRFATDRFDWSFASGQPRRVAEWLDDASEAVAVMNGVYFREDDTPAGFLTSHGTTIGKNRFDLDKSALIELAPQVRILDTATDKTDFLSFTEAAQSYPLLVRNGIIALSPGSQLVARRSILGLDAAGNVYLGIISDWPVTLYDLSHILLATGVPWTNVINLDGGPSSGLAVRGGASDEVINSDTVVPIVIVAKRAK